MRTVWRLAIGSWLRNPGRALAAVLSVALGVATVVITTDLFETTRRAITDEVVRYWLGSAHVTVHPVGAHWSSIDGAIADDLRRLENVQDVTARLKRRLRLIPHDAGDPLVDSTWWEVDAVGIDPDSHARFQTPVNLEGRMPRRGDRGAVALERDMAGEWGVGLGDMIALRARPGEAAASFRIVGLFDSARVAQFQRPTVYLLMDELQALVGEPGTVTAIDLRLADASPSSIRKAQGDVQEALSARGAASTCRVVTAEVRQMLLAEAERVTRLLLMLMAFVAMLTAFFIILTTQRVGLMLRSGQFGVMRCVGMTRSQVAGLVLAELMPLGFLGTGLGIAIGAGTTGLIAYAARDMFLRVYHSGWGITFAVICGLSTTLICAAVLVFQIVRVSPLEATFSQPRTTRRGLVYVCGGAGIALLAIHQWMVAGNDPAWWLSAPFAAAGTATLHFGYALAAPAVMALAGGPIARLVGVSLGIHGKLACEPIERGLWRSSGACWVLMVGLSLIVYTAVRAEGVLAIWDFPAKLPEAFVWSRDYVPAQVIDRVRQLPGVARTTTTADVECEITSATEVAPEADASLVHVFLRNLMRPVFVVGDPEELLRMVKIVVMEGDLDDALAKLKRGGYVVIPPPTARNKNVGVGDTLTITIGGISSEFEVAAVIHSPAMDLAVTAFQAESYMQIASASAVIGTRRDLKERFGLDVVSMFMCDLDLPPAEAPPDFDPLHPPDFSEEAAIAAAVLRWADRLPNEVEVIARIRPTLEAWLDSDRKGALPDEVRRELRRYARATQRLTWSSATPRQSRQENWDGFRSRLILYRIAQEMDRPNAILGSLRRLKQALDDSLHRATAVVTWLPSIMLVVATIGVANLIMVSVHLRSRQIAVLRAVGAQKSQIVRVVLVEALTIGLVGGVLGLGLGLHEAHSVNRISAALIDLDLEFLVPFDTVAVAILLTVGVALVAAIAPARYAARNNIIDALHSV